MESGIDSTFVFLANSRPHCEGAGIDYFHTLDSNMILSWRSERHARRPSGLYYQLWTTRR